MAKAPLGNGCYCKLYYFQINGTQITQQIAFFQSYSQRNNGNNHYFGGRTSYE